MSEMKGIIVAAPVPFDEEGRLVFDPIRRHVDACIADGAHGFWINGCTALAPYTNEAERRGIAEVTLEHIAGRVPAWIHVGALTTAESCRLAEHARTSGAAGVSSLPPLLYPTKVDRIVDHLTAVQQAAQLPTTYYHVPPVSNVALDADQLVEICERVPGLESIKFSDFDMFKAMAIHERLPHVRIVSGYEEVLLGGLAMGCFVGAVGAGPNLIPGSFPWYSQNRVMKCVPPRESAQRSAEVGLGEDLGVDDVGGFSSEEDVGDVAGGGLLELGEGFGGEEGGVGAGDDVGMIDDG